MMNILIVAAAAVLMFALLCAEKRDHRAGLLISKTTLSFLFVMAAWLQPQNITDYRVPVMVGLLSCMGGDVCLVFQQRRMFLLGLIFFLAGHILYGLAFFEIAGVNAWTIVGSVGVLMVSAGVYVWLRPYLGTMRKPVLIYVLVISGMVSGALTVMGSPHLNPSGRSMVLAGALLFYVSDVFVARDRFLQKEFLNRLLGLPMYYGGQFLLAFSVGAVKVLGLS